MRKRLFLFASFVLLFSTSSLLAIPVGVFNFTDDIGRDAGKCTGYGFTQYVASNEYRITASGNDIWGKDDGCHFAYNQLSGDQRVTMSGEWIMAPDGWSKFGVMIRNGTPGNIASNAVFLSSVTRRNYDRAAFQTRRAVGNDATNITEAFVNPTKKLGLQRVTLSNGDKVVEGLADWGSGWESYGYEVNPSLDDLALFGVVVTAHKGGTNNGLAQAKVTDVEFTENPDVVGDWYIPASAKMDECPLGGDFSGFLVRAIKAGAGTDLKGDRYADCYPKMDELLDTGEIAGVPGVVDFAALRLETLVNLCDGGEGGNFKSGDGYPDHSFPSIDPNPVRIFPQDTSYGDVDPPGGDDQFATEALGCIYLTEGWHTLGGRADDGLQVRVGGVVLGQTSSWNNAQNWDFYISAEGLYELQARAYEDGGGADMEVYEILADGTRILLNDRSVDGASHVYVPEPATIALLGFGGLAMVRIRKKR